MPVEPPAAEPAPVLTTSAAEPPAPRPEALKQTIEQAGLVWIETDPTKAAPTPVVQPDEAASAPRPRRQRRPRPAELDAPLMQVETKND